MYIDTHCHLSKKYYNDINKIVEDNKKFLIDKIIISGCERDELKETLQLVNNYNTIYATIGYHPDQAEIIMEEDIIKLENLIKNSKKVIGIGEIGLDYHYDNINKKKQRKIFELQLKIAEKLSLPVVIHSRDATLDTIEILKKYKVKGIIHCFSGSLETAKIYIEMGFKLGIGGVLTFKNSQLYKVIEKISLDNIVLETDSPYLTPEPYRGKTNSSKYIPVIAERLSQIKCISISEVAKITSKNCYDLFDLNLE